MSNTWKDKKGKKPEAKFPERKSFRLFRLCKDGKLRLRDLIETDNLPIQ